MNRAQTRADSHGEPRPAPRGCTGKKAYSSWREANIALRHTLENRRRERHTGDGAFLRGYRLEPYHCPHCREWHIGNGRSWGSRCYETARTFKRAKRWAMRMGVGAVIERRIREANGRMRYRFFVYSGDGR
jgi:uncharacterized membrane protein YkoI